MTVENEISQLRSWIWGNAAGTCRDPEILVRLAEMGVPNVMFGSITMKPRPGNPGDNYFFDQETGNSINALGLPNRGFQNYMLVLPQLRERVEATGAKLWVSISAGERFDESEYHGMASMLFKQQAAHVVEGNFSCPNIDSNGTRKPVVCFDPDTFNRGVRALRAAAESRQAISVKLAPITDPGLLSELVDICLISKVDYIVAANTIGNCVLRDEHGRYAIAAKVGGLAGVALRPLVRGMILQIAPRLIETTTKLIACGGIFCGQDAWDYLQLGADGFMVGTALMGGGQYRQATKSMPEALRDIMLSEDTEYPGLLTVNARALGLL